MSYKIAYFSMEIGLRADLPTYSGGLGVLAGDTLKSAADLGVPAVGVSLIYHKGYFKQSIEASGRQKETAVAWNPKQLLKPLDARFEVEFEGKKLRLRAWRYDVRGARGHVVPVYFLDSDVEGNEEAHRRLCDHLYGGDEYYRIGQETILGRGGVRLMAALGLMNDDDSGINTFHMNEGHAAFLTLELLERRLSGQPLSQAVAADLDAVKELCVFTTHTPVAAGHDRFPVALVERCLGKGVATALARMEVLEQQSQTLNMTLLALRFARYVNGVAKRHGEVSRHMFPGRSIDAITNGVHAATWASDSFAALFDRWIPRWREDNAYLRYVCEIPPTEIAQAHRIAKNELVALVKNQTGIEWESDRFTIGFARRAATYKRADLLFWDMDRLRDIALRFGGLQICYSGKAHPKDEGGKNLIERVVQRGAELRDSGVSVVYLPNYDMNLGRLISSGVDIWLNNPVKPMEASGTSGMKAALNGVPSLSTLDGWWVEGHVEGVTGWEIEDAEDALIEKSESGKHSDRAAGALYDKLEKVVLPMFQEHYDAYMQVMRHSIALNGSYFNTQRMVEQYIRMAYLTRGSE